MDPWLPTRELPGSDEKVAVLVARAADNPSHRSLFVAGDAELPENCGYLPGRGFTLAGHGHAGIVEEGPCGILRFRTDGRPVRRTRHGLATASISKRIRQVA
jgi:hypothetical protein